MSQILNWQLTLDHASATPMWSQIAKGICRNISRFRPSEGTVVISERQLAADLKLHRNTVRQAYADLRAKKILVHRNCRSLAIGSGAKELFKQSFPSVSLIFHQPFSAQLKSFSRQGLEIFGGIMERASQLGISVNIAALPEAAHDIASVRNWIENTIMRSIGIINFCTTPQKEYDLLFNELVNLRCLPQVLVSSQSKDGSYSSASEDYSSGFSEALSCLKQYGHHTLAIFEQKWPLGKFYHNAVYRGQIMEELARQNGFETTRFYCSSEQDAADAVEKFMLLSPRPTAIWCQNDLLAMDIYDRLKNCGFQIPEDISVIGFDNDTDGFLASVDYSRTRLGAELVDIVWELHNRSGADTIIQRTVPSKFYLNKTIGKAKI